MNLSLELRSACVLGTYAFVVAPPPSGVPFPRVWVQGNPIGTDPDPNVTPPAANRILTLDAQAHQAILTWASTALIRLCAIGGTTLNYQAWAYDIQAAAWIPNGPASSISIGTTNISFMPGNGITGPYQGSQWFFQVTVVTGVVTAFGYWWS